MEKEKPEHSTWVVVRFAPGPRKCIQLRKLNGSRAGGACMAWLSDQRNNDPMTRKPLETNGMSKAQ